jgi:hypothetical protein
MEADEDSLLSQITAAADSSESTALLQNISQNVLNTCK